MPTQQRMASDHEVGIGKVQKAAEDNKGQDGAIRLRHAVMYRRVSRPPTQAGFNSMGSAS
jgi:hypothetical protein